MREAKRGIDGVDLKLARAKECLAYLQLQVSEFADIHRDRTIGRYDADSGDDVIRVAGNLPPLNWAIPMGEFAHALRTSLDNLLWALIIRRGGTPVPLVTQFPIYENDAMIRPALPGVADWTPPR